MDVIGLSGLIRDGAGDVLAGNRGVYVEQARPFLAKETDLSV
ncbi:MAG: hypothetical protein AAFO70_09170 [Pseudomonadota bacterium]